MKDGYNKLFSSLVTSTVWQEPDPVRVTWITMLALADKNGVVISSIPGLANVANVTLEACEAALATFMAPDKYSRTEDHEGRRIEKVDGGWRLLNHGKYRAILSEQTVRAQKAAYMRRKRAADRQELGDESQQNSTVENSGESGHPKQRQRQSQKQNKAPPKAPPEGGQPAGEDVSRGTSSRRERGTPVTLKAWLAALPEGQLAVPSDDPVFKHAKDAGLPRDYIRLAWFVFKNSKIDDTGTRYIDWRQAFRNYIARGYLRLWRSTSDGGYELTSIGEQNMRAMKGQQDG